MRDVAKDCHFSIALFAHKMGMSRLEVIEKYGHLFPVEELSKIKKEESNELPVYAPKRNAFGARGKLKEIKDAYDKFDGDKELIAKEVGVTKSWLNRLTIEVAKTFPDFYYHNKAQYAGRCIFPTNEERLYALDNPESQFYRGRIKTRGKDGNLEESKGL